MSYKKIKPDIRLHYKKDDGCVILKHGQLEEIVREIMFHPDFVKEFAAVLGYEIEFKER